MPRCRMSEKEDGSGWGEKVSASSLAIGILKDDANTLQSKKGGEEDGMGRERDGGIRGILRIGFTIFEKNTLPRGKRWVGRNRCSITHISCKICSKIHRIVTEWTKYYTLNFYKGRCRWVMRRKESEHNPPRLETLKFDKLQTDGCGVGKLWAADWATSGALHLPDAGRNNFPLFVTFLGGYFGQKIHIITITMKT